MKRPLLFGATLTIAAIAFTLFTSCSDEEGGQTISNSSKLTSSTLRRGKTRACSSSSTTCTPDNLQGRVFAAGALLGPLGSSAYNMTFLANSASIITNPSDSSHGEGTQTFTLTSPSVFSGLISIPTESGMPSPPTITRLETMFDYVDATFTLSGTSGGSADGTYTIRWVFRNTATVTGITGNLQWGDKLVKAPSQSTFKWCDSSNCNHTTRPSSPLTQSNIVAASAQADTADGNPNYVMYSIDLATDVTTSYTEISCTTCLWTIDYNLSSALAFTVAPSNFTSTKDVVNNTTLKFACNYNGCNNSDDGIKATLTIGAAGTAS